MSGSISRYNFKSIAPIPDAGKLVDIVLSKTNRKTPTEIRANFKITRIRKFYMRKVKFTQTTINEKLQEIVDSFPKLDDIHPFYADLMNVLYDKDHYKLALGHCNKAKAIVDRIANDYVKLMKYADSLYRCKMLKRAGLGRMATLLKKLKPSLGYLEEVRKHLGRLPNIDTSARTLLITGYPNVGKSSFMNNITKADVDVQNYPFTTQSLFVGHIGGELNAQVIDTPGLLDRPISERNTIEMQAITALAYLNAAVLYLIDISEQCGYTIKQQIALFKNIKKLFYTIDPETQQTIVSKPIVLVLTKIDQVSWEELDKEDQDLITATAEESKAYVVKMSNITKAGVDEVTKTAIDILVDHRLTQKSKNPKKAESILNRVYVANPVKKDKIERPPTIPTTFVDGLLRPAGQKTILQQQVENGGCGVWSYPYQEDLILDENDWKYDNAPTFFRGKNVADFYDPDIEEKLNELEREEEYLQRLEDAEVPDMVTDMQEKMAASYGQVVKVINYKKGLHAIRKEKLVTRKTVEPEVAEAGLAKIVGDKAKGIVVKNTRKRQTLFDVMGVNRKRKKIDEDAEIEQDGQAPMEVDGDKSSMVKKLKDRKINFALGRMDGADPLKHSNKVQDESMVRVRHKIERRLKGTVNVTFADRKITTKKPRHLYSGKRTDGKTDRR